MQNNAGLALKSLAEVVMSATELPTLPGVSFNEDSDEADNEDVIADST